MPGKKRVLSVYLVQGQSDMPSFIYFFIQVRQVFLKLPPNVQKSFSNFPLTVLIFPVASWFFFSIQVIHDILQGNS